MNRRVTISVELVEPLERYGKQFLLANLSDIANHFIRHHLAGIPTPALTSQAVPAMPPGAIDTGNPLDDLSQLMGGL